MDRLVPVLSVSPVEEDHVRLKQIFSRSDWLLLTASNCWDALLLWCKSEMPVVISEISLPPFDWKYLLKEITRGPNPPRLIVTSQHADHYMWVEVLDQGAYDLLTKPFNAEEVLRVVSTAWRDWKDRWEWSRRIDSTGELTRSAVSHG